MTLLMIYELLAVFLVGGICATVGYQIAKSRYSRERGPDGRWLPKHHA